MRESLAQAAYTSARSEDQALHRAPVELQSRRDAAEIPAIKRTDSVKINSDMQEIEPFEMLAGPYECPQARGCLRCTSVPD